MTKKTATKKVAVKKVRKAKAPVQEQPQATTPPPAPEQPKERDEVTYLKEQLDFMIGIGEKMSEQLDISTETIHKLNGQIRDLERENNVLHRNFDKIRNNFDREKNRLDLALKALAK
jgi:hypothetical protein